RCTTTRRARCFPQTRSRLASIALVRDSRRILTVALPSGSGPRCLPARRETGCRPCPAADTTSSFVFIGPWNSGSIGRGNLAISNCSPERTLLPGEPFAQSGGPLADHHQPGVHEIGGGTTFP